MKAIQLATLSNAIEFCEEEVEEVLEPIEKKKRGRKKKNDVNTGDINDELPLRQSKRLKKINYIKVNYC